jgi:hypothetical protein
MNKKKLKEKKRQRESILKYLEHAERASRFQKSQENRFIKILLAEPMKQPPKENIVTKKKKEKLGLASFKAIVAIYKTGHRPPTKTTERLYCDYLIRLVDKDDVAAAFPSGLKAAILLDTDMVLKIKEKRVKEFSSDKLVCAWLENEDNFAPKKPGAVPIIKSAEEKHITPTIKVQQKHTSDELGFISDIKMYLGKKLLNWARKLLRINAFPIDKVKTDAIYAIIVDERVECVVYSQAEAMKKAASIKNSAVVLVMLAHIY